MKTIKVAVLPGGGMRGYLTLAIIQKWERVKNKIFSEEFNVIFGESTGSILGLPFQSGCSSDRPKQFYKDFGKNIFTPQNSWLHPIKKIWQPVYDRNRVLGPLKELYQELKVERFGDCHKEFVCGSVNECTKQNVFFKTTSEKHKNYKIEDIVVRSFAAPNYFGKFIDNEGTVWSDGGSGGMNCPIIPAFLEAFSKWIPGDKIEITVFGTGTIDYTVPCSEARGYNRYSELWEFYLSKGEQLGRIQGYFDQVNAMNWLVGKFPDMITFNLYNPIIPEKLAGIDGYQYLEQYEEIGESVVI